MSTNEHSEIDIVETFAEKVRAGQPIHITDPLDEVQRKLHVVLVNRLREMTGMPVQVVYS